MRTERGTSNKSSAVSVEVVLADEDQYETADSVFAKKKCDEENCEKEDEKDTYMAPNDVQLKREEHYMEVVALGESHKSNLYGNDDESSTSGHLYEESKPASRWSGLSDAESQRRGNNEYENTMANEQQNANPYVNNEVNIEDKTNVYINEDNVYDNDENAYINDHKSQKGNITDRLSATSVTLSAAYTYANDENVYDNDGSACEDDKESPSAVAKSRSSSPKTCRAKTREEVDVYGNDDGGYSNVTDHALNGHDNAESNCIYISMWP